MDNRDVFAQARRQLALDYNCDPDDFCRPDVVFTASRALAGRRWFAPEPNYFKMATFGQNAVICAAAAILPDLRKVCVKPGPRLFEQHNLTTVEAVLARQGRGLWQSHHMYLPVHDAAPIRTDYELRWHGQDELHAFYDGGRFPNALCAAFTPQRPDMLAVAAYDNGTVAGMAGCSADSELFWQIGIDVFPAWQGRGLGACLVSMLKDEIARRGKIPYYGTSLSNLYSQRIALRAGFTPAWVEITSKD